MLRQKIIDILLELCELGLSAKTTTSGNISVRIDEENFFITPSGIAPKNLRPENIVKMNINGDFEGNLKPSSEWRFHRDVLKAKPEANGVIHTHAPYCSTIACMDMDIPPFHYMIAVAGGTDIKCAKYATYGTQELSDSILVALKDRNACLLSHHGMLAIGGNLEETLKLSVEVENLAREYWQILQIGKPKLIDKKEMKIVMEKFKTYGNPQMK